MRLLDTVHSSRQRLVMPLVGQPAARLTGSTLLQNENNAELQARSIKRLYETLKPDAVFMLMNLTVEAGALGLPVLSPPDEPPTVERHPVSTTEDLIPLRVVDPIHDGRLHTCVDVVRRLAADPVVDVPIGAYVTGPFTLAGLLMGATEVAVGTIENPVLVHQVLELATQVIGSYAALLHQAGANLIAVLEPTAVFLSPASFRTFSAPYLRRLVSSIDTDWVLHICGDSTHLIGPMCSTGVSGLSLDADVDLPAAAAQVPEDMIILGNIDPVSVITLGTPAHIRLATAGLLAGMAAAPNFIVSTGCDVPLTAPMENVRALISAAREP